MSTTGGTANATRLMPKGGKAEEVPRPGKRKAEASPPTETDDDVLREYLCPITQELPVVFCTAEDGHCYDRWALEKWMEKQDAGAVRSPMTKEPMDRKLFPAVHARNAVDRLITKGIIAGNEATEWKDKQAELEAMTPDMRATVGKAFKGDAASQRMFAFAYRDGTGGVKKSLESAWAWFTLAAEREDPTAIVSIGVFHMNGLGTTKDGANGMAWLTRAAMLGSEHGCICLGKHYAGGGVIRHVDLKLAKYWFTKSLKPLFKDSIDVERQVREKWLQEHGHWVAPS